MALKLTDSLDALPDVTPRELQALAAASFRTVGDVLLRIPRRYEDRRSTKPVAGLVNGETVSLLVHVYSAGWRFSYKRYYEVSVGAEDEPHGARLLLRWFNMPYVAKLLAVGMTLSVYGKVKEYAGKLTMSNPDFEVMEDEDAGLRLVEAAMGGAPGEMPDAGDIVRVHTGRIVPIYRGISGLAARRFRTLVWDLLQRMPAIVPVPGYDVAPTYPFREALQDLHFPAEPEAYRKARLRFALAECFAQQFRVAWRRRCTLARPGRVNVRTDGYLQELLEALPFELTSAQARCVAEIRADMAAPRQMNRLLQGDVGSGKTLVALCAMLLAVESGGTAAMIAPTQILAEQHFNNFRRLLAGMDVRLSLRTSDRSEDLGYVPDDPAAADDTPRLLVGTHALLYKKSRPRNLVLAVVDEQHKFGVAQREKFIAGGDCPDVLVMTATPIPRTLTLTLYGDLDVSVIDELPANRGEIITALRHPNNMKRIISFMQSELAAGRQIYIVAPLIEESDSREQAAATTEFEKWKGIFPQEPIGLLHGRLSPDEKDAVMAAFRANETHILVATTVVEVGVDVPNATIMLINDADAFGLSQLHQLRGRIGRGQHKSYCILLSTAKAGEPGREKLEVLCRTLNGFEIAEEDFRLRGPGDVLGTAQSGLGAVQFTEWLSDMRLIHRAGRDAAAILEQDPELSLPQHAVLRELVAPEEEQGVTA
ncbi:MAG: ATP-dependent DNA helicase RecG [Akkermansia sp.]|nr:ATP-dependent DNA helicase RecG [Akkermansia sp.]MBQ6941616.1 ATP-dependent DNA helicase RecG [Akkermansia sp.]